MLRHRNMFTQPGQQLRLNAPRPLRPPKHPPPPPHRAQGPARPAAANAALKAGQLGHGPGGRPLTRQALSRVYLIAVPPHVLLGQHIVQVADLRQPFQTQAGELHTAPAPGMGSPGGGSDWAGLRMGEVTWDVVGRRGSDLIGGHSPEVQVGVAGGGVQPVLAHGSVHIFWGCLGQELVQALAGGGGIIQHPPLKKHQAFYSLAHAPIYSPGTPPSS